MKKNTMMRVASALLVAVLLTTCAISGTFAKYVSSTSDSDTARVAKWGWGSTAITIDLFDTSYDNSVESSNTDNVIAPGTRKSASIVYVAGNTFKPEVDYKLTFTADADIPTLIEDQLNWTLAVNGGAESEYYTFADLVAALEAITYNFDANTAPTINVQIGWVWAFEDGSDAEDTYLGNMDTLLELEVEVTMTATQLD